MQVIEKLVTVLSFKDEGAEKLKKFSQGVKTLADSFVKVGSVISAANIAAFAFTTKIAVGQDDLGKFAKRLGISVSELEEWGYVAQLNGSSAEAMQSSLAGLSKTISEVSRGQGDLEAFGMLGLSVTDFQGRLKSASEMVYEIADAIKNLKTQGERLEFTQRLGFNEDFLLALQAGGAALREQRREAEQLGFALSDKDVKIAADFADAWLRVKSIFAGLLNLIGTQFERFFIPVLTQFKKWYIVNKKIIEQNIGLYLQKFFNFVLTTYNVVRRFVRALNTVIEATVGWKVAIGALGMAILLLNAKILLIPLLITAATVGLVLLAEDFIKYIQGADSMIGSFVEKSKVFKFVLEGIVKEASYKYGIFKKVFSVETLALFVSYLDKVESRIRSIADKFEMFYTWLFSKPLVDDELDRLTNAGGEFIRSIGAGGGAGAALDFPMSFVPTVSKKSGSSIVNNTTTTTKPNVTINVNGGDTQKVREVVEDTLRKQYISADENFTSKVEY